MRRKFGPVIAERQLVSRGNTAARVRVSLGQPRPDKRPGGDWECPFRIRGPRVSILEFGYGVDSMQALTTALEGIRVLLDENFGSLACEDGFPDSGFQRQLPLLDAVLTKRLERLVDRELNRYVRQLKQRAARRRGSGRKKRVKATGASSVPVPRPPGRTSARDRHRRFSRASGRPGRADSAARGSRRSA